MAKTTHLEAHAANQFIKEEDDDKIMSSSEELASLDDEDPPPKFDAFTIFDVLGSSMGSEPKTLDEAFNSPKANKWKVAYAYELNQLKSMGVRQIVDLPKGETAIPCQIMFKEKLNGEGKIETYQIRIVAGGHNQVKGKSYNKTFMAAAKSPSI